MLPACPPQSCVAATLIDQHSRYNRKADIRRGEAPSSDMTLERKDSYWDLLSNLNSIFSLSSSALLCFLILLSVSPLSLSSSHTLAPALAAFCPLPLQTLVTQAENFQVCCVCVLWLLKLWHQWNWHRLWKINSPCELLQWALQPPSTGLVSARWLCFETVSPTLHHEHRCWVADPDTIQPKKCAGQRSYL